MHRRATTLVLSVGLAATLGLTLAACGTDSPTPAASRTASNGDVYNTADVDFATAMIPHHAQALSMVDLTEGRPLDPPVRELAEQIRSAQAPEIQTMSGWLSDWGREIPETMRDHSHAGHDSGGDVSDQMEGMEGMDAGHGRGGMPGMMTAEEMDQLQQASDVEFQRLWLDMMIDHHEGAVDMARSEVADGRFRGAVALARQIADSQRDEIERMQSLLG